MRAALLAAAGLLAACNCDRTTIVSGAYGAPEIAPWGATDYRVVVSEDHSEITESYVVDGHRYVLRYRAR